MPRKPKNIETDWRRWTFAHFKEEYEKAVKNAARDSMGGLEEVSITYVPISDVLVRLLGKVSNSWRRDILNADNCIAKEEKYRLLEEHDQKQLSKLIMYALNDRPHSFGATKVLQMVAQGRMNQVDYSLNNKEAAADHLSFNIEASGRFDKKDKDDK